MVTAVDKAGDVEMEDGEEPILTSPHLISIMGIIIAFLVLNALLLSAYAFTGSGMFSALNNGASVALLGLCAALALGPGKVLLRHPVLVPVLVFALIGTLVVNSGRTNFVDVVKFLGIFAFYFVGRYVIVRGNFSRFAIVLLVLIPLAGALLPNRIYRPGVYFSYFPNANTAVIYFTAVIFCYYQALGPKSYVLQIFQVIAFQKIGAILATFASIFLWNVSGMRLRALLLGAAVCALGLFAWWLGLLDRVTGAVSSLYGDIFDIGIDSIVAMPYSEIIQRQGTTDLSGYFRIKHWIEIWMNYSQGGPLVQLFGYGPGRTPFITYAELIPHNDYLRILAEFGLLNFGCFVAINVYALKGLKDNGLRIFFTILLIYYISENLIDNFASMAMFYVAAGIYAKAASPDPSPRDPDEDIA